MTSKPASRETLGLVKAALAEPSAEDAARKLELVKRLESDVDFRHAIEKRNEVAEEAQNDMPGVGVVRAEELLRRLDAKAQPALPAVEIALGQDTVRDLAPPVPDGEAAANGEAPERRGRSLTQPSVNAGAPSSGPASDEETAPPLSHEERRMSNGLIALALVALVALGALIWLAARSLLESDEPPKSVGGATSSAVASSTLRVPSSVSTHPDGPTATSRTQPSVTPVLPSGTSGGPPVSSTASSAKPGPTVSAKPPAATAKPSATGMYVLEGEKQ